MRHTLYRYNAETCQYERVRTKPLTVVAYASGLAINAAALLVGLLLAHDYFFDSAKEVALRNENRALQKNHLSLTRELTTIEASLQQLQHDDQRLHVRFFGSSLETPVTRGIASTNRTLPDADDFRQKVDLISQHSENLLRRSSLTSAFYGSKLSFDAEKLDLMKAAPTLLPVKEWSTEKLISGYGTRVDPFHKGLYEHTGVDISLPRGTEVLATAPGWVTLARKSSIPAGYGNYIEIDHGHGLITRYAHLGDLHVKQGQRVSKGQVIAASGNSGGSVAPHLHYEIIRDGVQVDPIPYMIEGLGPDEHHRMKQISKIQNQSLD